MAKKTKRGAKAKKTTRKRSRVVVRKRTPKRITKRTTKRKAPPRKRRRTPSEPPPQTEYSVNVSYRNKHKSASAIGLQFSVFSKPGRTRDEIQDAIIETIANEGEAPKGFKVRLVSWKGGRVPRDVEWATVAIIASDPITRFSVQ